MASERRKCLTTLGLQEGAGEGEIKKAYKRLALQYHPDKNDSDDAKGKFQEIGYAYKYLTEGPSAFGATNPHDVREDILRHIFEEMFFSRFRGPFGGFSFYCEESDDDDYYMHSDSSDNDCYCGSCHTGRPKEGKRPTYQNTYPRTQPAPPYFPPPSKKQLRKREKRHRQKERQKEKREQQRKETQTEKQPNWNIYTSDVNTEPRPAEKSAQKDNSDVKSEVTKDSGESRPNTPSMNQQPEKANKMQKKKIEAEQKRREREMAEIGEELKKKQEQEMEKRREKERKAALKREEEKDIEIDLSHLLDNGKKSRKAKQREKKRQESANNIEPVQQTESNSISSHAGQFFNHVNSNSSSGGKEKEKSVENVYKSKGRRVEPKKSSLFVNRFDVLEDIDDDFSRPQSRSSVSSQGSIKNPQLSDGRSQPNNGASKKINHTSVAAGFGVNNLQDRNGTNFNEQNKANISKRENLPTRGNQFKSKTYQNSNMNQNNSNNGKMQKEFYTYSDIGLHAQPKHVTNEGNNHDNNVKKGAGIPRSLSDDGRNGINEFEDSEREFIEDWSVYVGNEEDSLDDLDLGCGTQGNAGNKMWSGYNSQSSSQDNFGYGYDKTYQRKTRGYHNSNVGPYYGGPPGFPTRFRGPPPFPYSGMYPPPPPPHFRGGYPMRPSPSFRGGRYPQPRYSPPMGPAGYGNSDFPRNHREANIPYNFEKTVGGGKKKTNMNSPKKVFQNENERMSGVRKDNNLSSNKSNERITTNHGSKAKPVEKKNVQLNTNAKVSCLDDFSTLHLNESKPVGHSKKNKFSSAQENQAGSKGSLDSLDEYIINEPKADSADNQTYTNFRANTPPCRPSSYPSVDIGLDEFLSKDSLGVPNGMFTDNIKNYYK